MQNKFKEHWLFWLLKENGICKRIVGIRHKICECQRIKLNGSKILFLRSSNQYRTRQSVQKSLLHSAAGFWTSIFQFQFHWRVWAKAKTENITKNHSSSPVPCLLTYILTMQSSSTYDSLITLHCSNCLCFLCTNEKKCRRNTNVITCVVAAAITEEIVSSVLVQLQRSS